MLTRAMPAHGRGGMEDHTLMLARGIVEKGYSVTVITTGHPHKEFEETDGVEIHYLKKTRPRSYSLVWWRESLRKFEQLHRNKGFDLIHSQSIGGYALIKRNVRKKYGIPVVMTFHGTAINEIKSLLNTGFSFLRPGESAKKVAKIAMFAINFCHRDLFINRQVDKVIGLSDEYEDIFRKFYHIKKDNIHTIHLGTDTDLFSSSYDGDFIREKYGLERNGKLILSASRLAADKGIQNIIRSMPQIINGEGEVKLIILGDGSYRKTLEKLAADLGLSEKVMFLGFVPFEEMPYFFNVCDLFVNPTIRETGYDHTIPQAMACEKTAVVSRIGGVPFIIEDGKDGVLVLPGNIEALASKIIELLGNARLAKEIGKNARSKVVRDFSINSMANKTIEVYESMLGAV